MGDLPSPLAYLLLSWVVVTVVLIALVMYRAALSTREDDQIYLNRAEVSMMADEQRAIIGRLERLGKPIAWLAVLSGALLMATAGVWVWIGFKSF
jgi:hypothetical protein